MAKKLATTKGELIDLYVIINKAPSDKVASNMAKYLGARKAVKSKINVFLDKQTELYADYQEKVNVFIEKEVLPKQETLSTMKPEDKDYEKASKELKLKQDEQVTIANEGNKKLKELRDTVSKEKAECTFDNEDFLYIKKFITENASTLFKANNGTVDGDYAQRMFDLLDSVK